MKQLNISLNSLFKHKILIFILLLVAVLRIPSLSEPYHYADEDIYLTLGQGLRKGLIFYQDLHDNKPPLLYLTAAIAGNITNFKFILLFWNLINVIFVWFLAQKFFKSQLLINLVTLLFGLFSTLPLLEGNIANAENFMALPVTIAAVLFLKNIPKLFLAGALFSLGFLFKFPVIFELAAFVLWLTFYQSKTILEGIKKIFSPSILKITLGFLTPIGVTIVYYYLIGAGQVYVKAAFLQNLFYVNSWENHPPFYQSSLFFRGVILLISIFLVYLVRKRLESKFVLVCLWFIFALFGVLLPARPYPHYLIQILLPAILVIAYIFAQKQLLSRVISISMLGILALSIIKYEFWYYPTIPYYKNYIFYKTNKISQNQYFSYFGYDVLRNYQIASFISSQTSEDQKIFIWGTQPAIYVISNRLPVGKYTVSYHVRDFNGFNETFESIKNLPPKFIVYYPNEVNFSQLDSFISRYYFAAKAFDNIIIFQLR